MDPRVDDFLGRATRWRKEMEALRSIVLECGLTEDLKWGKPCYMYNEANVCIIQGFKEYLALLFFKGFMMTDPEGILLSAGPNARVGRQIKVYSVKEIIKLRPVIKSYIYDAIEVEKSGAKVMPTKQSDIKIPEELEEQFRKKPKLKSAFLSLTPGRQKGYIIHFTGAKQYETRVARIEKYTPQIMAGVGINDEYLAKIKKSPRKKAK